MKWIMMIALCRSSGWYVQKLWASEEQDDLGPVVVIYGDGDGYDLSMMKQDDYSLIAAALSSCLGTVGSLGVAGTIELAK